MQTAKVNRKRAAARAGTNKFLERIKALDAEAEAWRVWNETGDSQSAEEAKRAAVLKMNEVPEAERRIPASDRVDPVEQLPWVAIIAKQVAEKHRIFGEAEIEDIAGDATIILLQKHPQFSVIPGTTDFEGAFRGWIYLSIKKECERSAERLLNAGTYKCRRQIPGQPLVISIPISMRVTNSGEQIDEPSRRNLDPREEWQKHRAFRGTLLQRCA